MLKVHCKRCGEEAPTRGSLAGLVHLHGPTDHPFESDLCTLCDARPIFRDERGISQGELCLHCLAEYTPDIEGR